MKTPITRIFSKLVRLAVVQTRPTQERKRDREAEKLISLDTAQSSLKPQNPLTPISSSESQLLAIPPFSPPPPPAGSHSVRMYAVRSLLE